MAAAGTNRQKEVIIILRPAGFQYTTCSVTKQRTLPSARNKTRGVFGRFLAIWSISHFCFPLVKIFGSFGTAGIGFKLHHSQKPPQKRSREKKIGKFGPFVPWRAGTALRGANCRRIPIPRTENPHITTARALQMQRREAKFKPHYYFVSSA